MTLRKAAGLAVGIAAVLFAIGGLYVLYDSSMHDEDRGPSLGPTSPALIARGEYLTRAADCAACHTAPAGRPFAGGLPFKLPFGTIYSTNITADRTSGIGSWSDDDFVRALHRGVARGGRHLYPAFPYTSFTGISREDALAIKAYLFSLPPAHVANKTDQLSFPFNQRWGMAFWNLVFLRDRRFTPDPDRSATLNRGAYLATALGHCGECHTPRNLAYGLEEDRPLSGAVLEGWKAYNLSPDLNEGLGAWSDGELASYLAAGHADGRGSAAGPMGEVVENSLQYLSPQDISALVSYLRAIPPQKSAYAVNNTKAPAVAAAARNPEMTDPQVELGRHIFADGCSNCHEYDGGGRQTPYASLTGSASVNDRAGANLSEIVLRGAQYRFKGKSVFMPPFGGLYSDAEIAAVADYVIRQFGGKAGGVTPAEVSKRRGE